MLNWVQEVRRYIFCGNTGISQLLRCCIVGAIQNGFGFLLYIMLNACGLSPQLAISFCYPLGMLASYMGNKRFAFRHNGQLVRSCTLYVVSHGSAYGVNLLLLYILVDLCNVDYILAQFCIMSFLILYFFVLYKFFVFKTNLTVPPKSMPLKS